MRGKAWIALMAVLGLGAACGHHDVAARGPELETPWGASQIVATNPSGVVLILDGDADGARSAVPGASGLIPVRVTVRNGSGTTLDVRYSDFALTGMAGQRYPALLPAEVVATATPAVPSLVATPVFMSRADDQPTASVQGKPPVWPVPALSRWETSFPYEWGYIKGFYGDPNAAATRVRAQLLPEGRVASGDTRSGLLYFAAAAGRDGHVALRADLREADDGMAIGRALIPLRVVR
jgi:hypothetical protein